MVAVVKKKEKDNQVKLSAQEQIDRLAAQGKKALKEMKKLTQEQIDHIVKEMALAGLDHHMYLAKFAVEETGRGVYEDKIIKNMFATEYIYHNVKYDKTVVINENPPMVLLKLLNQLCDRQHLLQTRHQTCSNQLFLLKPVINICVSPFCTKIKSVC